MHRDKAIALLCREALGNLSTDERMSFILDWWSIDESDPEFQDIPESLRSKIKDTDESDLDDVSDSMYDPLILIGLRAKHIGVRNEYLRYRLYTLTGEQYCIEGTPEKLSPCPCCYYCTRSSVGEYEICPVCFWEDSGQTDPAAYSSPNCMSLAEARNNFATLGAISSAAREFIDSEGKSKWIRQE